MGEEEEEEEKPKKKPVARKPAQKRKATPSGSEGEDDEDEEGSDEEEAPPSDGGGSDYEPDKPVKINKSRSKAPVKKKKAKYGSDDEGSSGEEWGAKKSKPKKKAAASDDDDSDFEKPKKSRKKKAGGGDRKAGGYTAPVKLSEELADIVGGEEMPRHEVVKRMWAYIKENKLQDPKNKSMIKCDDKLAKIVPTKKFRGFGMTKYLKDHMNVDTAGESVPLKKATKAGSEDDSDGGSE